MDKIKELLKKGSDNDPSLKIKLILLAGIVAVLMLSLPDLCAGCGNKKPEPAGEETTPEQYAAELEQHLEEMISSVDGAGKAKVMVTLQNGMEYIYASEDKTSVNTAESITNSGGQSSEAKENSENNYIIIDTEKGEQALIRTALMPSVSGVVVVCEGADDPVTSARIEALVTTALDISPKRVCITLLTKEQ